MEGLVAAMNDFTRHHPAVFVVGLLLWAAIASAHLLGTLEYGKVRQRSAFEVTVVALAMLVIWPVFSLGMTFRGYGYFWDKHWGTKRD